MANIEELKSMLIDLPLTSSRLSSMYKSFKKPVLSEIKYWKKRGLTREYPVHPMAAASVVIRKGNRILLVQRATEPGRGLWGIPGGLVKLGEKVSDAAIREVQEETGLTVKIEGIFDVVDYISRDSELRVQYHYVIVDFLGHPISGRLKASSDSLDARWVDIKDLKDYKLTKMLRNVFKRKDLI